jgi:MSHA pilin protein MshC
VERQRIELHFPFGKYYAERYHKSNAPMKTRGFTLIELILILTLVGILAVAAIPRFFNSQDFQDKGFYDQTLAILRYGQKAAIAQRRTVCVAFTSTSVTLMIAGSAGSGTCDKPLVSPTGVSPFAITGGTATFSSAPVNFKFNSLGEPLAANDSLLGATQTITVSRVGNIQVEAETGYVHP